MSDSLSPISQDVLRLTAAIVSAHVAHNQIAGEALPELIGSVYRSLSTAGQVQAKPEPLTPAVPWKKSVFPDFIVCLEDGKKLTMLKRHLKTSYNLSPQEYRAKWGLPSDYPMVAPNYASRRAALAKSVGLGRRPANQPVAPAIEPVAPIIEPVAKAPKTRRARS